MCGPNAHLRPVEHAVLAEIAAGEMIRWRLFANFTVCVIVRRIYKCNLNYLSHEIHHCLLKFEPSFPLMIFQFDPKL